MQREAAQKAEVHAREADDGGLVMAFSGRLVESRYRDLKRRAEGILDDRDPDALGIDLSDVEHLDDHGTLLLLGLHRRMLAKGGECQAINASGAVSEILELLRFREMCEAGPIKKQHRPNVVVSLGEAAINQVSQLGEMAVFTGSLVLSLLKVVANPGNLRLDDTVYCMRRVGVDAVPIVALISFLMGFIIAFMSSVQLQPFGAQIFVASLVSLAMVRELGPIMTCILVAGRSGSAFASEIGTMVIREEVDALRTMGFDPVLFLVVPKTIASLIVVPLLTMFACLFGIFGGLVVGVFILDLTYDIYIKQTIEVLDMSVLVWSFTKTCVFAVLVAWVSCLRGFQVSGGATEVGEKTTSAVVSGIFLVILVDSMFAMLQLYWG
ncbi:MAG: MlaE family lipid ABC transporter permease subunit [Desulfatibacillaceae bacterium]